MPEGEAAARGGSNTHPSVSASETGSTRRPAQAGRRGRAPGASPATERGRQTRQRILDAAAFLLGTRGFERTRIADVLRASGAGKSQFYHYFDNKSDLIRAVLRQHRSESLPAPNPQFGHLDSWPKLAAWFDEVLRSAARRLEGSTDALSGTLGDSIHDDPELRVEAARTVRLRRRLLHRGLRRMQVGGDLRVDASPNRLATFAAAALEGGLRTARIEGSVEPLRQTLGETFAHLESFAVRE